MNIPLLIILKDFIIFCDENNITEPTQKDIRNYIASEHFNFLNESPADFDTISFENAVAETLGDVFKNKIKIANTNNCKQ